MSNLKTVGGKKPKTKRSERALLKREPQVHENVKTALFLKGPKTNETITSVLRDLYMLKKPDAVQMKKRNKGRPFEDVTELEFYSEKNDCSLFAYGSNTKKRPSNLVLGRFFDHHILDMLEFAVTNYKSIHSFQGVDAPASASKPCFIFRGPDFEYKEEYRKFANLLVDFFRGIVMEKVNLVALDHVIICTALDGKIYFRHYAIKLKKSGSNLPRVELVEVGPSLDLQIRRTHFAAADLQKQALRLPKEVKAKKVKNISTSVFGKAGLVHKGRQDLDTIQTRKMKGLKRKRNEAANQNAAGENATANGNVEAGAGVEAGSGSGSSIESTTGGTATQETNGGREQGTEKGATLKKTKHQ